MVKGMKKHIISARLETMCFVDLPVLWKDTSAETGLQEKDPMAVQHLH